MEYTNTYTGNVKSYFPFVYQMQPQATSFLLLLLFLFLHFCFLLLLLVFCTMSPEVFHNCKPKISITGSIGTLI